jgi:MFS-type transporter involved in bile tolerance (Atg22 family)
VLAGAAAATGIALINSIGNLAGFLGPAVIGWLVDRTGSTDFGIYALAGVMAIGSLLVLTVPERIVNR